MRTWYQVSPSTPCSICGKPDWCRVTMDGAWAICRRVNTGVGMSKRDKNGAEYWLYRLDGGALHPHPVTAFPTPSRCACADTNTLDRIYGALLYGLPLAPFHRQALQQRGL